MYKIEILSNTGECLDVIHLLKKPQPSFLKKVRVQWSTKIKALANINVYHLEKNYAGSLIQRGVS